MGKRGTSSASLNAIEPHKFKKGNRAGKGNPHAKKVNQFRAAMIKSIGEQDVLEVLAALMKEAKGGKVDAIREFLDRLFGKSAQPLTFDDDSAAGQALATAAAAFNHAAFGELYRQLLQHGGNTDPVDRN